jgi:hypothetical protein
MRHPQVPVHIELTRGRRKLFVVAIAILALTFVLAPFHEGGLGDVLKDLLSQTP